MHSCTILDDELMENAGNDDFVLPSLRDTYNRHFPVHSDELKNKGNYGTNSQLVAQVRNDLHDNQYGIGDGSLPPKALKLRGRC